MKILVLAPHADDAELGCGGTIIKLIEEGHEIRWVVFSTAEESLPNGLPKNTLQVEFRGVMSELNMPSTDYDIYNYQVRCLHEQRQTILEKMVVLKKQYKPNLVIGPSLNDMHQDHQVVANEMIRAFKTDSAIISYELPWNHISFNTQLFSKLSESHIQSKIKLLNNYKSQIINNKSYFKDEFIRGLATTRGIQCNSSYAEAFEVIRWMI